jgi:DNA-binding NarL/FixJ family response regulator
MTGKIRVVLSDDHPIVLKGLRDLIAAEDDLALVGEATTGTAALKLIRETQPDVAVVDISMPEMNGILLSRRLLAEMPALKILVLTLHEDRTYLRQALEAGVQGYVLKRSASESLIEAIRTVAGCGTYVDPSIAMGPARVGRPNQVAFQELTSRETDVLKLVALGFTNKEIAGRLDIGVKSIETYKARGTEKLGLKSRADLVRYASAQGWLADI